MKRLTPTMRHVLLHALEADMTVQDLVEDLVPHVASAVQATAERARRWGWVHYSRRQAVTITDAGRGVICGA